jgi:predicted PurR-regulated permease PerM
MAADVTDDQPIGDNPTRFERRTFGVLLLVAAVLFMWTVSPVWVPVFLGVLLAVVASPLQRRLERRYRRHPRMLAALISFVTVALGIGLIVLMGYVVVKELLHYLTAELPKHAGAVERWLRSAHVSRMLSRLGQSPEGVIKQAQAYGHSAVTHLSDVVGGVLAVTSHGLLTIIFTTITSYYLLLEGPALARFLIRMVPLPQPETRALMHEFHDVAVGTLLGIGVIAIVQGVLAGIGFWIFRVDRPIVWATLAAISSLLPAVGTGVVCLPVAVAQMLTGHFWLGFGLMIYWGIVITSIPDYWLRPRLMAGHMRLHSLLVLIAVFGGIEAFGAIGILLGPMFVAMFVAMLRIYERDYRPIAVQKRAEEDEPHGPTAQPPTAQPA